MCEFTKRGSGAGDAFASLRSMPGYRTLSAKDQKAVRELINEELERFKTTASSVSRGRFRRWAFRFMRACSTGRLET